jgi:hypothetical protein
MLRIQFMKPKKWKCPKRIKNDPHVIAKYSTDSSHVALIYKCISIPFSGHTYLSQRFLQKTFQYTYVDCNEIKGAGENNQDSFIPKIFIYCWAKTFQNDIHNI